MFPSLARAQASDVLERDAFGKLRAGPADLHFKRIRADLSEKDTERLH
jgi:hypothetical protein